MTKGAPSCYNSLYSFFDAMPLNSAIGLAESVFEEREDSPRMCNCVIMSVGMSAS